MDLESRYILHPPNGLSLTWLSCQKGSHEAAVPAGVQWDAAEQAFTFSSGGSTITVDLATNPNAMDQVSYEAWFKLPSSPGSNKAWLLSQTPDYGWSRAVTLNDNRLGYTSITTGSSWNSGFNVPSINEWHHVVGAWDQDGASTVYLDGVKGESNSSTSNGAGSNSAEVFNIGGNLSKLALLSLNSWRGPRQVWRATMQATTLLCTSPMCVCILECCRRAMWMHCSTKGEEQVRHFF